MPSITTAQDQACLSGATYCGPRGKAPTLPANIRLGWKYVTVANTLAYYGDGSLAAEICFIVQAQLVKSKKYATSAIGALAK